MNKKLLVRKAQISDIQTIYEIDSNSFKNPYSLSIFNENFDNDNYIINVAIVDNVVVGYILINYVLDEANISKIVVESNYRNQGIATELLNYSINHLLKNDIDQIFLEVDVENIPAIKFYEKNNFVTKSIRKKYYGNNDALIMWYQK